MSSDDMRNAIEFLLQSQANFEFQLEKNNRQLKFARDVVKRENF
jgi:type III secretory pathway component EscU